GDPNRGVLDSPASVAGGSCPRKCVGVISGGVVVDRPEHFSYRALVPVQPANCFRIFSRDVVCSVRFGPGSGYSHLAVPDWDVIDSWLWFHGPVEANSKSLPSHDGNISGLEGRICAGR